MATAGAVPAPGARLPHEVTSFVGRRRERAAVRETLSRSRLVTLTGFGGVGKTRLALRVAADLRRAFAGGVCFVSLGELADPALLCRSVGTALGAQWRSTGASRDSLAEYIGDRRILLILDNCEHMLDASAVLADALLRRCAGLRILTTSREPLRVDGESVHPVAPLTFPGDGRVDATALRRFEAVDLFVDRARAVVPDFELSASNGAAVAEICSRLEGIPLAIELAAVRSRTMSVPELAGSVGEHWEVLTGGSRAGPDRQRTMAACIDWSLDLCSPVEREVAAAVSVFSEGFEVDAARAVCGEPGGHGVLGQGPDLADVVAALVEKSIVLARERDGVMRFRMLPPLRHRGLSRLEELGTLNEVRRRHRDWYADLAGRAQDDWVGPRQLDWIKRLRREEANLQAAFEFSSCDAAEAVPGLWMGARLLEFGMAEGLFHAGCLWFDRLFRLAPEPSVARAFALRTACWWSATQGDLEGANGLLAEGERLAGRYGEPLTTLFTQTSAMVALFSGDFARAIALFDEAISVFRASGDVRETAPSLYMLALAHALSGDYQSALACHERCVDITEPQGELWSRAYSTWVAGFSHWRQGRTATGTGLYEQSLRLSRETGDPVGIGLCLEALAWIAAPTDPERAAVLLGAAERAWERIETSTAALPGLFVHHEACVRLLDRRADPAVSSAWERGRSLSRWDAARHALGEDPESEDPSCAGRHGRFTDILTHREREVAELVARGHTNREVAATLVISRRTAETHVLNILRKLSFTSRHQIMAWVTEQRETADEPERVRIGDGRVARRRRARTPRLMSRDTG